MLYTKEVLVDMCEVFVGTDVHAHECVCVWRTGGSSGIVYQMLSNVVLKQGISLVWNWVSR